MDYYSRYITLATTYTFSDQFLQDFADWRATNIKDYSYEEYYKSAYNELLKRINNLPKLERILREIQSSQP